MNWLKYVAEHGVGFAWNWKFGKPRGSKEVTCDRCHKIKSRHWTEGHSFEAPDDGKKEIS